MSIILFHCLALIPNSSNNSLSSLRRPRILVVGIFNLSLFELPGQSDKTIVDSVTTVITDLLSLFDKLKLVLGVCWSLNLVFTTCINYESIGRKFFPIDFDVD